MRVVVFVVAAVFCPFLTNIHSSVLKKNTYDAKCLNMFTNFSPIVCSYALSKDTPHFRRLETATFIFSLFTSLLYNQFGTQQQPNTKICLVLNV